ncbi:MAG: DNA helicase RecG, partial [Candidatus Hydrothermia bacterium]
SYCILIRSKNISEDAQLRLEALEKSNDGFYLAEADLEIRGPGEFLGTKQHGFGGFRILHLRKDKEIIEQSKIEALKLINNKDKILNIKEISENLRTLLEGDEVYVA